MGSGGKTRTETKQVLEAPPARITPGVGVEDYDMQTRQYKRREDAPQSAELLQQTEDEKTKNLLG